jgi:hypothetical protein
MLPHKIDIWREVRNKPEGSVMTRGACSPETRQFGNLSEVSKPLRLATYWAMDVQTPVHERYPEWDADSDIVRWDTSAVLPDVDFWYLLMDKFATLRWLEEEDPCCGDGIASFVHLLGTALSPSVSRPSSR